MIPKIPTRDGPFELFRGFVLPFSALRLIFKTPALRRLSALCALVTLVALLGSAIGAWWLAGKTVDRFIETDWLQAVLAVVLFVAFFAIGALTLPNLVLAPLQDPLGESTERALGADHKSNLSLISGTAISIRHTLLRLLLMTLGGVVLFPLNVIPGVGSVLYLVLSTGWTMLWLSVEHLSNPMARHGYGFRKVMTVIRQRPFRALGFGAALFVILWVPILNCLLMPVAVVAGTMLFVALRAAQALPEIQ